MFSQIDHIVVNQRRRVDHLHHRGQASRAIGGGTEQRLHQQAAVPAAAVSAARLQILIDGGDRLDRSDRFNADFAFYFLQIRLNQ